MTIRKLDRPRTRAEESDRSRCRKCQGNVHLKGDILLCQVCGETAGYRFDRVTTARPTPPEDGETRAWDMTHEEAKATFNREPTALKWLTNRLWPTGAACPECAAESRDEEIPEPLTERRCNSCGKRYNLLTNTGLEAWKKPLKGWLLTTHTAMVRGVEDTKIMALTAGNGLTAKDITRLVTRARAMVKEKRDPLEKL